jgi:hypothetical protein
MVLNELAKLGWSSESLSSKVTELVDVNSGEFWAHSNCAVWSCLEEKTSSFSVNVDKALFGSLSQKCSLCSQYGASAKCQANSSCSEIYHYPCASVLGIFQNFKTHTVLCLTHSSQASSLCKSLLFFNLDFWYFEFCYVCFQLLFDRKDGDDCKCQLCEKSDRPSDCLFCSSCGSHYHVNCLLPNLTADGLVTARIGWQCPDCKICLICK